MATSTRLRDRLRDRIGPYSPVIAWYRRYRPAWWWLRANPSGRVTRRLVAAEGTTVQDGAFRGLRYPEATIGHVSFLGPKLLGSYELEVCQALRCTDWSTFVDIGAAEGFFCVGMALANPAGTVIGYEADPHQQRWAHALARENGVELDLRGSADPAALRALAPAGPVAVLCDVEGAEWDLLVPEEIPWMRDATIVVELHEANRPGVTAVLQDRFAASHHVAHVTDAPRSAAGRDALQGWAPADAALVLSEGRGAVGVWLVMRPSGAPSSGAEPGR